MHVCAHGVDRSINCYMVDEDCLDYHMVFSTVGGEMKRLLSCSGGSSDGCSVVQVVGLDGYSVGQVEGSDGYSVGQVKGSDGCSVVHVVSTDGNLVRQVVHGLVHQSVRRTSAQVTDLQSTGSVVICV